jgi:hypothetical protein
MAREVREGQTEGGLPYLSFGERPLLVVFPGLGMTNANPSGIQRWGEMRLLAPLARTFTVRRRVGLAYGTTMEDLAYVSPKTVRNYVSSNLHQTTGI